MTKPGSEEVPRDLLIEAGAILASSLDPTTTMEQVARLTVPRLADLCVIDLRDEDGAIRDVAVAATEERIARELEELRARYPLDPAGEHPVAQVIRSGEPVLLAEMTDALLRSFAQGSEHARFMIENGYRSAVVAPMLARGRTLGALSALRLGESQRYGARTTGSGLRARAAGRAGDRQRPAVSPICGASSGAWRRCSSNLAEAITVVDSHGQTVFANQAAADLLGFPTPGELTARRPGTIMPRFIVLDEQGRELDLESMPGEAAVQGRAARAAAGEKHRPRHRRGALADRPLLADHRPRERSNRATRSTSSRTSPRSSARSWRELHGRGQPCARLLDGLRRDAAAGGAAGGAADRRLVRGRSRQRARRDRTRGGAPHRPAQARAGRAHRPRLPPGARRARRCSRGDPHGRPASSTTSSPRRSRLTPTTPSTWNC